MSSPDEYHFNGEPENDMGNVEYKLLLQDLESRKDDRLENLVTQMQFRLFEGQGDAIYVIGVTDEGSPQGISEQEMKISLETLDKIAKKANAKTTILRTKEGETPESLISEILIRKYKDPEEIPPDIQLVSIGNVDAGKSTLIGVLESGKLDDGRGTARTRVFRFKHELESGRTSSVSTVTLGYDIDGKVVNHNSLKKPSEIELLEKSCKTVSFYDLAGHEKYLRTTIFGLTGLNASYAMLIVAANQGVLQMTKEHIGLVIALKIPFFVIITKTDMTPSERTRRTIDELKKVLKIPGVSKVPFSVKTIDDVILSAQNIKAGVIAPIFNVSSVSGKGIDLLTMFLNIIPSSYLNKQYQDLHFGAYITEIFNVTGVGTVVAARIYSGSLKVNEQIQIGPFEGGKFRSIRVKSIHYKRVPTTRVRMGQNATFALHNIKPDKLRKGMVLLDTDQSQNASYQFEGEVYVLFHSTTIRKGYAPVIHAQSIQQSAKILNIDAESEILRTGDTAFVKFEFMYRAEHIKVGQRFIFREGKTKGIGTIVKIYPLK
jgi:GTPase